MSKPAESDALFFLIIFLAFLAVSIGTVGWQIYTYLKYEDWHSISLITAMRWFEIKWAISPSSWLGLYKIMDYIPLSVASFFTCIIFFIGLANQ